MKIIAKTSDTTFLVEITQYQLNLITGKDCGNYCSSQTYKVGESFDPVKNWEYLDSILKSKDKLFSSARNLRSLADMIESVPIECATN
jgi:hypothetical protein